MNLNLIARLFPYLLSYVQAQRRLSVICFPMGLFVSSCMGMGPHMREGVGEYDIYALGAQILAV